MRGEDGLARFRVRLLDADQGPKAVWAVFGPIAASMAVSLGMDPRLVLAGVSVGSIICFATPMAAPAPAYAYSAAGFTMKEYIKMGWFPCVLMTIVFVLWAPLVLNWLY